ncbi:hypothetical protein SO802_010845 [Lithocarpus litseifolius]|uniref:Uncharacterized protein n=1 Tax=Lithocarpus litseifolius TaxID=425828 RepID=A0AAW2DHZ4_9ROSI
MEVQEGVIELVGDDLAGHEDGAENHGLKGVDKDGRVSCSVDLGVQNSSLDEGLIWRKLYTKSTSKVVEDDGFVWYLTGFHGWPEANEKWKSWAPLSHLWSFSEGSWPGSAHTKQRLDGATANRVWIEKLPASSVSHLFSHASDNLPILLKTMNRRVKGRGAGDFKFVENWLLWADCDEAVTEAWTNGGCGNSGLSGVRDQIQACGAKLHAWGSSKTKPETKEIKRLQIKLEVMNESELTEDSRKEFLRVSK